MLGPGGAQGLSGEKAHADLFFWRHSEAGLKTPDIISILYSGAQYPTSL